MVKDLGKSCPNWRIRYRKNWSHCIQFNSLQRFSMYLPRAPFHLTPCALVVTSNSSNQGRKTRMYATLLACIEYCDITMISPLMSPSTNCIRPHLHKIQFFLLPWLDASAVTWFKINRLLVLSVTRCWIKVALPMSLINRLFSIVFLPMSIIYRVFSIAFLPMSFIYWVFSIAFLPMSHL